VPGGATYYNVPHSRVKSVWKLVAASRPDEWYLAEMAPHDDGLLQGEVMQSIRGLYLHYTMEQLPMREALQKDSKEAYGIMALGLLRSYMDATSYDWFQYLLDAYPNHVIEFSTFSVQCGTLAWNTLFWEVRLY
jgi:hypothetical protein